MKSIDWIWVLFIAVGLTLGLRRSPLEAQSPTTFQPIVAGGSITVNGGTAVLSIPTGQALGSLGIEAAGTWTGTIQVECAASRSGSGAFVALTLTPRNSATTATSFTGNGQWSASILGCQRVQARATNTMTGSASITLVGVPM